jgi:hypothetical protein
MGFLIGKRGDPFVSSKVNSWFRVRHDGNQFEFVSDIRNALMFDTKQDAIDLGNQMGLTPEAFEVVNEQLFIFDPDRGHRHDYPTPPTSFVRDDANGSITIDPGDSDSFVHLGPNTTITQLMDLARSQGRRLLLIPDSMKTNA